MSSIPSFKKGFTLIELLVVIAIIAILAPFFSRFSPRLVKRPAPSPTSAI